MKIDTKFNIGDTTYIVRDSRLLKVQVKKINIYLREKNYLEIRYYFDIGSDYWPKYVDYRECEVFANKEDFINSLK